MNGAHPAHPSKAITDRPVAQSPLIVAVVGAGPSGIYAAEALSQQVDHDVRVAVIDRLPVPFGLVRYGVAPDHESIRSIRNTLERTLEKSGVRFYGDVTIGRDLTVEDLRSCVDAVIYAFGAASDRRLGIPGEQLIGSLAAPEFVNWYCGHPDVHPETDLSHADAVRGIGHIEVLISTSRSAVVVGAGNVALDVARVLIKTGDELDDTDMAADVLDGLHHKIITDVHFVVRRGPAYTTFTTKELRELGQLEGVEMIINPGDLDLDPSSEAVVAQDRVAARNVEVFRTWAARPPAAADTITRRIHWHFWTRPTAILGDERVSGVALESTQIDADGSVSAGGEVGEIQAQLIIRSIGYRGLPMPGVPYDDATGRVPHAEGRVIRDGGLSPAEYVTGWIKRGPTGVIGTNKSDAVETVNALLADIRDGEVVARHDPDALDRLLAARGIHALGMPAWHAIDAAEVELGHSHGRDRTTLAHRSELLSAADGCLANLNRADEPSHQPG